MKKEHRFALNEFARSVPDEEIRFLCTSLVERLCGDVPNVLGYAEQRPALHAVFIESLNGVDLFAMLGELQTAAVREAKLRNMTLKLQPLQPVY